MDDVLWIVTPVSNPLQWKSRIRLARAAITDWLREPNVRIVVAETAYGSRPHELDDLVDDRVIHVPLRANTMAWSKENTQNIAVSRLPDGAKYVAFLDADIHFRKDGWARRAVDALQLYPVIQPWRECLDMGPDDDSIIAKHNSFASLFHDGKPVVPSHRPMWKADGGPYDYAHSGFGWCWTMDALNRVGGLFECGGMGSGDYHMALGLIGEARYSIVGDTSQSYEDAVIIWQQRALTHVNQKLGYTDEVISHDFHGSKAHRYYIGRWGMFQRHRFDPIRDLKRNVWGVIEFAGNKPALEREWANYLRSRREDGNQA
ncbi:MAG: hypothetical protein ABF876_05335 [Acetobacter aceti]